MLWTEKKPHWLSSPLTRCLDGWAIYQPPTGPSLAHAHPRAAAPRLPPAPHPGVRMLGLWGLGLEPGAHALPRRKRARVARGSPWALYFRPVGTDSSNAGQPGAYALPRRVGDLTSRSGPMLACPSPPSRPPSAGPPRLPPARPRPPPPALALTCRLRDPTPGAPNPRASPTLLRFLEP
jgi:hypothetical protein